jgi:hypothetical protein
MVEWSRAFDGAPIHLYEAERPWVMRPDPCIRFWKGRTLALREGLSLVSTGGHFEGYQVLHWPAGAGGRGALMAGDQPQICMDPKQVTLDNRLNSRPCRTGVGPRLLGVRRLLKRRSWPQAFPEYPASRRRPRCLSQGVRGCDRAERGLSSSASAGNRLLPDAGGSLRSACPVRSLPARACGSSLRLRLPAALTPTRPGPQLDSVWL